MLLGFSNFIQTDRATALATAGKEKREKAEKEEKDKEEKEKKEQQQEEKDQTYREDRREYREDRGAFAQIISNIVQNQNDTNQTVPQSIISRGTSAVNISTITSTSNSNKQIIVSSKPTFNRTPRRQQHQDKGATNITHKIDNEEAKNK